MSQPPLLRDHSPAACDRIIIVGAGGFGREVLQWARQAWPEHVHKLTGFISADLTKLDGHAASLPILAAPNDFEPRPTDGFVLGIGIPQIRRVVAEQLEAHGARFLTLIHPTAIVADTAVIGPGSVICPYAIVSAAVRLGRCVLVNYHASLGHDAKAGDFTVLSPYATLGGEATVGADVFMALHSSVGPAVHIGSDSAVAANSCALENVGSQKLTFGVPGRVAPRILVDNTPDPSIDWSP